MTDVDLTIDLDHYVGRTDERLVSFNLDWHKNDEESPLWINMSAMRIDFSNPKLRKAASAMYPARLRIGGSEGDVVCYDVPMYNSTCDSMGQNDTAFCLSMERFEEIAKFASDTNLELVFGLNAVWGRKNHNLTEPLDMTNIRALLKYASVNRIPLYGVELGNEKCGPPPDVFAKDYENLKSILNELWSDESSRPKLIGNDCNTNPSYLKEWLPLLNDTVLDVLTYHRYVGYGLDPQLASEIMTPKFLDQAIDSELTDVHSEFAPSSDLWVGEGAAAWHSGRANVTDAWVSSFWWSDALGTLAQYNHTGYQRQTLIGGAYGLINRVNFTPNPDYYVGLLFKRLMGDVVLKPMTNPGTDGWLRVYAHCTNNGSGDLTVLAINVANDTIFDLKSLNSVDISNYRRDQYVFTSTSLNSRSLYLNGKLLQSSEDGSIPDLEPQRIHEGGPKIVLNPQTISFFVFKNGIGGFNASVCNTSQ